VKEVKAALKGMKKERATGVTIDLLQAIMHRKEEN